MVILSLPVEFTTLNEFIAAANSSRYTAAKIKKADTNKALLYTKAKRPKFIKDTCYNVHFHWYKPDNRLDHDNIAFGSKFILDGIAKSKAIQDDSPRYINNINHTFELDRTLKHRKCVLTFTEVD